MGGKKMDKSQMTRREILSYRINDMLDRINSVDYPDMNKMSQLAREDKYVRVCGESYRAVSLNDRTPLMGFTNKGNTNIKTIYNHFKNREITKLSDSVWKTKEERRVQAWLIKQALINKRSLKKLFGLNNSMYDDLYFALDEISLGDNKHPQNMEDRPNIVRCDILAVGVIGSNCIPVLIELKYKREKKRLEAQLDNFEKEIEDSIKFKKDFFRLMAKSVGLDCNISLKEKLRKIIVWPGQASNSTIEELTKKDISVIEYEYKDADYDDVGKWVFRKRNEIKDHS